MAQATLSPTGLIHRYHRWAEWLNTRIGVRTANAGINGIKLCNCISINKDSVKTVLRPDQHYAEILINLRWRQTELAPNL